MLDEIREAVESSEGTGVDFAFDRVIYADCPVNPQDGASRGQRQAHLNSTTVGQLYLQYLFGVTQRQMQAIISLMKWRGEDGAVMHMFKAEDLVTCTPKTLPKLAKQLPLLPIYLKQLQVQTKHKGVVSTTLQVTHSLSDIVRRLAVLQQTSFDFMTFAAKTGLYQTNLWHGEVWRDSPLFTHHRILGGDGHYHVLGTLAA
jgi:hypothetical protein